MSDLISRDALCEYCLNTKDRTIDANDIMRFPSAEPERIIKIGRRSGKTLEFAIDFLQSTGWLQEHDRILTESAEPERTAKVVEHDASITDTDGYKYHRSEYLCGACKKKVLGGDDYCSHCGARLEWK